MEIRPHHAMCILNYVGKGYSDEFSENMSAIIKGLTPDTELCLVSRADAICSACPNRIAAEPACGTICNTEEKTARYDELTLEALGLSCGARKTYAYLKQMIENTIFINKESFASICGDCEWHELCERVRFGSSCTDINIE